MFTEFHLDQPLNGSQNMAIDEYHFHRFNNSIFLSEEGFCVVRVYEWAKPTISVGLSQKNKDIFNSRCNEDKLNVVSRITGGRLVLHHKEITYSVIAPINGIFGYSLHQCYNTIADILIIFLKKLGLSPNKNNLPSVDYKQSILNKFDSHFKEKNKKNKSLVCYDNVGFKEISLEGRKLIGSSQKRGKYAFLQHGSIPYYRHNYRLENYLKEDYHSLELHNDRYVFINDYVDIPIEEAKKTLQDVFKKEVRKLSVINNKNIKTDKPFTFSQETIN